MSYSIYHDGYHAQTVGRSSTENPYDYDTDEYVAWENGWLSAYEIEQEESYD